MSAYSDIPLWKFAVALMIVTVPVWAMEQYHEQGLTWSYVFIILLGFILANDQGMASFSNWINTKIKGA